MRSRCAISLAALRVKVKVMAAMRAGSPRPVRTRWAMRAQITRVFPDPGPAMTRIGPSGAVTASRWRSLSVARSLFVLGPRDGSVWNGGGHVGWDGTGKGGVSGFAGSERYRWSGLVVAFVVLLWPLP